MATTPVELRKAAPVPTEPDLWQSFRTEMDRVCDRFGGAFGVPSLDRLMAGAPPFRLTGVTTAAKPAIDVSEGADAYTLTAELPGMTESDIEVALANDTLTITGEKQQEQEQKDANYYVSERSYGAFTRSFALPDGVDVERIAASFAKGVLTVTLPKSPQARAEPKKIEVKAAA
jgi:HSP20 family protein